MSNLFDAHIHLDQYLDQQIKDILTGYHSLSGLISVSTNLKSCKRNLELKQQYNKVHPAFGFHPEQPLPTKEELQQLMDWISNNKNAMIAIGEVGLPYYLSQQESNLMKEPYIELLEEFIQLAKEWNKPIILHAVYEDAPVVCDMLERYSIRKAHFHWFKGDRKTVARMIQNGYKISITPDVCYEGEIQDLVSTYPLEHLMVETDGPWPFEGPFNGKMTHPSMMEQTIKMISNIKEIPEERVFEQVLLNTKSFYLLK